MLAKLRARIRNIFLAGLLVTLPIVITIYILVFMFRWVDSLFSPLVFRILQFPKFEAFSWLGQYDIPGLGVVLTVALIFFVGIFTKTIVFRRLVTFSEHMVKRIPVARTIYAGAKQAVELITMPESKALKQVVAIEYPRKGVYTVGFITSEGCAETEEKAHEKFVHIFVPTVPNPTTGFLLLVPVKEIIPLDMSVEDGVKLVISAGIIVQ